MDFLQNISSESLFYSFGTLVISFTFIYFKNKIKIKFSPIESLIPGPKSILWFGNSLNFVLHPEDISIILYEYVKKYGLRYRLWIGRKLYIVLSDADDVESVIGNYKFLNKGDDFHEIFGRFFGNGSFSSDGIAWKKSRRIIQNPLKVNVLENYIDVMNDEVKKVMKKLETLAISNETFNIIKHMETVTVNVVCKTLFDLKQDVYENEISAFVPKAGEYLDDCFRLMFQPKLIRNIRQMLSKKEFQDMEDKVSLLYKKVIMEGKLQQKRNSDEKNSARYKSFIEYLQDPIFSDKDKKDEINTYSVGGTETLSIIMSFTFLMLGIYKEVQKKVYEELHSIFGDDDRDTTEEDLKKMVYFEQVLKEVMRHYPLVPFLFRTTNEATTLRDVAIPAGTTLIINVLGLHKNQTYFPDPETFNPEHFSTENCKNLHKGCYLPFSAGPRNCISKAFAMYEMKIICSTILRKYQIHSSMKHENINPRHSFILSSKDGFLVSISKRH